MKDVKPKLIETKSCDTLIVMPQLNGCGMPEYRYIVYQIEKDIWDALTKGEQMCIKGCITSHPQDPTRQTSVVLLMITSTDNIDLYKLEYNQTEQEFNLSGGMKFIKKILFDSFYSLISKVEWEDKHLKAIDILKK